MKIIENTRFGLERALYNSKNIKLVNCRFEGEEDGESALKESCDIELEGCFMDLRYPLWHTNNTKIINSTMTSNCRAAMWYMNDVLIKDSNLLGIKALRECNNSSINGCKIVSPEFGWKCDGIKINDSTLQGEYLFFDSKNIDINNIQFEGKYSFQYVENLKVKNSKLKTKDAFWHTKNVEVYDTILEGEYLAWYSENLTLVRCHIKGTQPFCYCKNLKLVDCTMENTDLSFENSEVEATIIGNVDSIKNPRSGRIVVDSYNDLIVEGNKYPVEGIVEIRK